MSSPFPRGCNLKCFSRDSRINPSHGLGLAQMLSTAPFQSNYLWGVFLSCKVVIWLVEEIPVFFVQVCLLLI